MSRLTVTSASSVGKDNLIMRDANWMSIEKVAPTEVDWKAMDIDELVDRLTPGEIQKLLEEFDPDDPHLPPSERCSYRCDKLPTGPFNKKQLRDFINEQSKKTPDKLDYVPHVPGTIRGKKWDAPKPASIMEGYGFEDDIELDIDLGEDEEALAEASTHDLVDLASILGFHSMMNQDQFHEYESGKWAQKAEQIGFDGVTKATPLKWYPPEEPNLTNPDEVIKKMKAGYRGTKKANFNNIAIKEEKFLELFDTLKDDFTLEELTLANTTLSDYAAGQLAKSLEDNGRLERINLESNNISPSTLLKIFEAANIQQQLTDIKAANQAAQYLGNKVEMSITSAVEKNKSLLRVGIHFEYGDCRNRVAVQLQKNLDRVRLKRVASKSKNGTLGGYLISSHPSGLLIATKQFEDPTVHDMPTQFCRNLMYCPDGPINSIAERQECTSSEEEDEDDESTSR